MKIDRLQIKNFKAMEYVDLNIRGKSTVFLVLMERENLQY